MYLEPNSSSMVVQFILAGTVGVVVFMWKSVVGFLRSIVGQFKR